MNKKTLLVGALSAMALFSLAGCQQAESPTKDVVSVNSSFTKEYLADTGFVSVSIQSFEAEKASAEQKVNKAVKTLKEELAKLGVSDKDFETTSVYGYEQKNPYNPMTIEVVSGNPKGMELKEGYHYTISLKIKVSELDNLDAVVDSLNSVENVNMSYISYDLSNKDKLQDEVMEEAISLAKAKAEKAASHLGVKVDKIHKLEIQDQGVSASYDQGMKASANVMSLESASAGSDISPSKVTVSTYVKADFAVK